MKRNTIYLAVFAALSLSATACNDAVEHNIQAVDAPAFVGVSPQENIKAGLDSIVVTYDKNVFFASSQYQRITLNGQPVVSANVIGSSNKLLLMANIVRGESYELVIPEGVVSGPNNMPAPEVKATLKAQSQQITTALVNANATAETKALYQKLAANYGQKTFSGAMADVAWNTKISNQVHALTGKYPAINGYDYIHLQSTTPGGWIDYANIAPVKTWHDAGGMVTIGWHWNVPTSNPYASTVPVVLYGGPNKDMPSDWSGHIQLTTQATKDILAKASVGSKLVVKITNAKANAQGSIKNSKWAGFVDENGKNWDYFNISGNSYSMTLDQTTLTEMRANGLIIGGHDYTVTGVTVEAAGTVKYDFYAAKNEFTLNDAVTEGTWANRFMKSDLEKIVPYLQQLQRAGIPVLWRPLHEAAGKWFWWGNGTAENYRKLWHIMFNFFKQHGVNNLIWVWTSEKNDPDWYPGDEYVDIIGTDMYGQDGKPVTAQTAAQRFNELAYRYPTKMIALTECGTVADISAQWSADAKWSFFMPWYPGGGVVYATDAWWKSAMSNPNVITR
ncbi:MAG: glycoside hydrolase family 26 protein [Prevotella sp.]